jgi:hypothetical protein
MTEPTQQHDRETQFLDALRDIEDLFKGQDVDVSTWSLDDWQFNCWMHYIPLDGSYHPCMKIFLASPISTIMFDIRCIHAEPECEAYAHAHVQRNSVDEEDLKQCFNACF